MKTKYVAVVNQYKMTYDLENPNEFHECFETFDKERAETWRENTVHSVNMSDDTFVSSSFVEAIEVPDDEPS